MRFYGYCGIVARHFDKRLPSHRLDDEMKRAQVNELWIGIRVCYTCLVRHRKQLCRYTQVSTRSKCHTQVSTRSKCHTRLVGWWCGGYAADFANFQKFPTFKKIYCYN